MFEVRNIATSTKARLDSTATANVIGDLFFGSDGLSCVDGSGFQVYKGQKREKIDGREAGEGRCF